MKRSCLGAIFLLSACSSPPTPEIPPPQEIGPPIEAAASCEPPFPTFAQGWFLFADMDSGKSCPVFFEQDVCVLGIFDDCTDDRSHTRQWSGRVASMAVAGGTPISTVTLDVYEPDSKKEPNTIPLSPTCCTGPLNQIEAATPEASSTAWMLLRCPLANCNNERDDRHAGLYLETLNDQLAPYGEVSGETAVPSPIADAVMTTSALWVAGGDGLYSIASGQATQISTTIASRLIASSDGRKVFAAQSSSVLRFDVQTGQEEQRQDFGTTVQAMSMGQGGLLIATSAGNRETDLTLRDPSDLTTERASSRIDGDVVDASSASSTFVVATSDEAPLVVLTSSLARERVLVHKGGTPRAVFELLGVLGLLAQCSEDSLGKHCYLERTLDPMDEGRRLGIPDGGEIVGVAFDEGPNQLVVASENGLISVIDRGAWRPLFSARFNVDTPLSGLVRDPSSGLLYALSSESGRVLTLTPK